MPTQKKEPPFCLVIDTREQDGYDFTGLASVRAGIPTGDYSLVGYEHRVAVERKNKSDAWQCVAGERPRFERCLERLANLERAAIVIEADLRDFCDRPSYIQRVTPATAVGSYVSWSCKYRIPVFWCDTKAYAERITLRFLVAFLKHVALDSHLPTFPNVLPTGDAPDYRPTTPATANPPGAS